MCAKLFIYRHVSTLVFLGFRGFFHQYIFKNKQKTKITRNHVTERMLGGMASQNTPIRKFHVYVVHKAFHGTHGPLKGEKKGCFLRYWNVIRPCYDLGTLDIILPIFIVLKNLLELHLSLFSCLHNSMKCLD